VGATAQRLSLLAAEKAQAVAAENFARAASIKTEMEQLERALKWASSANDAAAGTHSILAKVGGYSKGGGGNLGGATGYGVFQPPPGATAGSNQSQSQPHSPGRDSSSGSHRRMNNGNNSSNSNIGYAGQSPIRSDSHYTTALHAQSSARPSAVQDPYVLATQEMRRTRAAVAPPSPVSLPTHGNRPPPSPVQRNTNSSDVRPPQGAPYDANSDGYSPQPPMDDDNDHRENALNARSPREQAGRKPAGAVALHGMRR